MKPQPDTHVEIRPRRVPPFAWLPRRDERDDPASEVVFRKAPERVDVRPAPGDDAIQHAYDQHTIACQVTTFLWVLAAALMYQGAAAGGTWYRVSGIVCIVACLTFGFLAQRRLKSMLLVQYLRKGLDYRQASRCAAQDVRRAMRGAPREEPQRQTER